MDAAVQEIVTSRRYSSGTSSSARSRTPPSAAWVIPWTTRTAGVDAGLEVHAVLGFAWGFRIRDEEVHLVPPTLLGPTEWDHHVDVLAARYPSWRFLGGFRKD